MDYQPGQTKLHYSVYRLYVVVKVYQASSINLISPLFESLHHYHTLCEQPKETCKFQPRKKPEPQQNYMTCIFVTDYLWIKRLYILL